MVRSGLVIAFVSLCTHGQVCLPYGQPIQLRGRLLRRDENGYRRWTFLKSERAACISADPTNEFGPAYAGVTEFQASWTGEGIGLALDRLVGYRVVVNGTLYGAFTGYRRTAVLIDAKTITPLDSAGEAALRAPARLKPLVRDVPVYDIVVRAGRRMTREARAPDSAKLLIPVDEYVPRWVTGGDVVYINCREGYEVESSSSSPKEAATCSGPRDSCAFDIPEKRHITLKMRCVRITS